MNTDFSQGFVMGMLLGAMMAFPWGCLAEITK